MSCLLGIDYGGKRIGLAASDSLGIAAHGLPTLKCTTPEHDLETIREIVEQRAVAALVVGLPRNMDGSLGPQAVEAEAFGRKLADDLGLPVHFVDERLTTQRAERTLAGAGMSRRKRKGRVDRMAAQFILQQYLDMQRHPGSGEADGT